MPYLPGDWKPTPVQSPDASVPRGTPPAPATPQNYEKLTPLEATIYGALPKVAASPVSKLLATFNNSLIGQGLKYLDVLAEGTERTIGTALQAITNKSDSFNLRDAWYAGSLTYDEANIPQGIYAKKMTYNIFTGKMEETASGALIGYKVPTDLPGLKGLADARLKIGQYVAGGMSASEALSKVRDEYYNGLGALSIRGMLQDTLGHIALDPLIYLAPELKLPERIQAARIFALNNKIPQTGEELIKMADAAREAGNLSHAEGLMTLAADLGKGTIKPMSSWDKFMVMLGGGNIFADQGKVGAAVAKLEKVPVIGLIPRALKLTPESRAQELMTLINDNIGTKIIARLYDQPEAEAKIAEAIQRATQGATGDFGYAFMTTDGRTAQAFMKGANGVAQTILENYQRLAPERASLEYLAGVLGRDAGEIVADGEKQAATFFRQLSEKAPPELAAAIQRGEVTQDTFAHFAELFKDIPYNKEQFVVHLMAGVEDKAMQQAIVQFGVQARGALTRWSNAVKSAESLAFMRLNPAYGIRNAVNNDFTMIARGVFGTMTPREIGEFWVDAGFVPKRLKEGFHLATEVDKMAGQRLAEALSGGKMGTPEKISAAIRDVNLGKDVTYYARESEQKASARAFTSGYTQWFQGYAKKLKAEDVLGKDMANAIEQVKPGLLDAYANAAMSTYGSEAKFAKAIAGDLRYTARSVLERASLDSGIDWAKTLDAETLTAIESGLPDAIKAGRVGPFLESVRLKIDNHVEQMFAQNVDNLVGIVKNQVAMGGYPAILDKAAEAQDLFWQAHIHYLERSADAVAAARAAAKAKDFASAEVLWQKVFDDSDQFFGRAYRRMGVYMDGIEQGAKDIGIQLPKEVRQAISGIESNWKDFYAFRKAEYRKFFSGESGNTFEALQKEMTARYENAARMESGLYGASEEAISRHIPDAIKRQTFLDWRKSMGEVRDAMRKDVIDFRSTLYDISPEDRPLAWQMFRNKQAEGYQKLKDLNRTGASAMNDGSQIAEYDKILPNPLPQDLALDQTAYTYYGRALDSVRDAAKTMGRQEITSLGLPRELEGQLAKYQDALTNWRGENRLAATRFAEFRRDSALLNYNRRINFDTWVGNVFPFAFWTTASMVKWAVESIDRPAMLSSYLRIKKFLETAGAPENGFPSRLKDQIRVELPFAPKWMGGQFIDPLRLITPFESFTQPFDNWQQNQLSVDGRAERLLQNQLRAGTISQAEFDNAVNLKSGDLWEQAKTQAVENDNSLKFDAWDFASLVSSPHAPLVWAYNALRGHPEDIGPFAPISRVMKNAATMLGVPDWNNSPYNLEGKVRKMLGLPAFDKWDDFRTDRALSDMAGNAEYPADQVLRAMQISARIQAGANPDDLKSDPAWSLYQKGVQRANQEYTGGIAGFVGNLIGLSVHSYPTGEQNLRQIQGEFSQAYTRYSKANDAIAAYIDSKPGQDPQVSLEEYQKSHPSVVEDAAALTTFFNQHPEYESRLGLFDTPEERMKKFLVNQTWEAWGKLPQLTKNELQDQLGPQFFESFMSKVTRSYDGVTSDMLTVWLKIMGGPTIGKLTASQQNLSDYYSGKLQLSSPETAWRVQVFYDTRKYYFADYQKWQNEYYAQGANKKAILAKYPDLKAYWDWRRSFMVKNPDIVPYVTDSQADLDKAAKTKRVPEVAVPTVRELNLSSSMQSLLNDYKNGGNLSPAAQEQMDILAKRNGMSRQEVYGMLGLTPP